MELEEILTMGAPFKVVQIKLSMKRKVARVLIPLPENSPCLDFSFADAPLAEDAEAVVQDMLTAGVKVGLLAKDGLVVHVVDLDAEVTQ